MQFFLYRMTKEKEVQYLLYFFLADLGKVSCFIDAIKVSEISFSSLLIHMCEAFFQ